MGVKRVIKNKSVKQQLASHLPTAFEMFIYSRKANNITKETIVNYERSYTYLCNYFLANAHMGGASDEEKLAFFPIEDILCNDFIEAWKRQMLEDEKKPVTINHYLRDIRAFATWCGEQKIIEPFKIKMVRGQEEVPKCFADEELALLLRKPPRRAEYVEWRNWAITNWVLATGNRAATICNIKMGDIDFREGTITLTHTKNKKATIMPLSPALDRVIKEYIAYFRSDTLQRDYLFPTIENRQMNTEGLSHSFGNYCKSRGTETTSLHSLRHSFARNYIRNGGNMAKLQKLLGHRTIEMTRRYVELFGEDVKEDFDRYSPLDNIKAHL